MIAKSTAVIVTLEFDLLFDTESVPDANRYPTTATITTTATTNATTAPVPSFPDEALGARLIDTLLWLIAGARNGVHRHKLVVVCANQDLRKDDLVCPGSPGLQLLLHAL